MKRLLTAFFSVLCCTSLLASNIEEDIEKGDSLKIRDDVYKEEQGFFQKAYRDATDPTFMFTDSNGDFSVGIGGIVMASAFYDFGGGIDSPFFNTAGISVPTDMAHHFGYTISDSDIYVKARGRYGKHKIAAYLELKNSDKSVSFTQAYVSLDGFTIGSTYSFFQDLQAGVRTVDLRGPNTQVDNCHPLVGYTSAIGKKFRFGVSLEQPSEISPAYTEAANVEAEFNRYPDLAAFAKYGWKKGHFRIAGILREQSYYSEGVLHQKGKSIYKPCYGLAVSGSLKPLDGLTLSGQVVGGRGISTYIKELSTLDSDLLLENELDDQGYPVLTPAPSYGGYFGVGYRISPRLEASAVFGYCALNVGKNQESATDFKSSFYTTVNLFYFLGNNCMAGLEYANGVKYIYTTSDTNHGIADRLDACFIYKF